MDKKSPRFPVTLSRSIKQTLAHEQTDTTTIWENMKKNKMDKVMSKNERRYYFQCAFPASPYKTHIQR